VPKRDVPPPKAGADETGLVNPNGALDVGAPAAENHKYAN
jgi:hypothetical protein